MENRTQCFYSLKFDLMSETEAFKKLVSATLERRIRRPVKRQKVLANGIKLRYRYDKKPGYKYMPCTA